MKEHVFYFSEYNGMFVLSEMEILAIRLTNASTYLGIHVLLSGGECNDIIYLGVL